MNGNPVFSGDRSEEEDIEKNGRNWRAFSGEGQDIEILEKEFGVKVVFADEEWIDEE